MEKIKVNDRLVNFKRKVIPVLKRNGVVRAGVFGSFARGEAKKGSDVDILIEIRGRKSLFDLARLEIELEKRVGQKVDVVEYSTVHPLLKDRILKEEVQVL
ncbi:MAG: nucleotidyltransferase family protein [Candidatus Altiarchaeota archaeon]|nr:nucleotidyltransferase family protein [Candidatus Altiarchaeota archaeon]